MKKEPYCQVLSRVYTTPSESSWSNQPYETNTSYPEQRKYKTINGKCVRSKSEVEIYNQLYTNELQFRYEWKQNIGNKSYCPDFTIIHPTTGELIYWEHFGMMDAPNYASDCFKKLYHYNRNGIIPNVNLIITFENSKHPLDSSYVKDQIEFFLL